MPFDGTNPGKNVIAESLKSARDRLLRRGWCQFALEDAHGRVCAIGAFDSMHHEQPEVVKALAAALPPGYDLPDWSAGIRIISYNNAPDRKMAEIVALFDRAISIATTPSAY